MLDQLTEARDSAQAELTAAEIVLLEATAAATQLREAVSRLESAVAALSGESPPATVLPTVLAEEITGQRVVKDMDDLVGRNAMQALSPDEFDAQRKAAQHAAKKAREAEDLANNPLAHLKCSGCGRTGTLQDTVITAPSGATVRMMVCYKCNNQVMA